MYGNLTGCEFSIKAYVNFKIRSEVRSHYVSNFSMEAFPMHHWCQHIYELLYEIFNGKNIIEQKNILMANLS